MDQNFQFVSIPFSFAGLIFSVVNVETPCTLHTSILEFDITYNSFSVTIKCQQIWTSIHPRPKIVIYDSLHTTHARS